jgi:TPR repeat protein
MNPRIGISLLLAALMAPSLGLAGVMLKGKVVLVGVQDQASPAAGITVTLEETGDSLRTKAGGLFNLLLPDGFRPGERITLQVGKSGWRIQYPLDGELRVPAATARERVEVRMLPVGSRRFWSDDRIEKFIADTAARAKEQVSGDPGDRSPPDFGRYIKEWASQYGFSAGQAKAEIERWIGEVQQRQDNFYQLGLAAFAEKNFAKAGALFLESASVHAQRLRDSEQRIATEQQNRDALREATIRDYRLAGDAAYNDYRFEQALAAYEQAIGYIDREAQPRRWAALTMDVAKAHWEIGIRTQGEAVHEHLAEAVAAYRDALRVRTREQLPQQWAGTQNNLGNALRNQGTRTGGEEGRRLLAEARKAFQGALSIYQAAGAGHYVGIVERNIARTEVFLSGGNDPEVQFTRGLLYVRGNGVSQDDAKAVTWFTKAAGQGHGQAQRFLGVMVLTGRGVEQDWVSGYAWVHLSAENGVDEAVQLRDQLRQEMEPSQLEEAEKLAGERQGAQQSAK